MAHRHHQRHPGAGQFPSRKSTSTVYLCTRHQRTTWPAAQAALANLPDTGEGAIFVQHAKTLVAKALEQQHAAADSQG
jgi:hypothetical protein